MGNKTWKETFRLQLESIKNKLNSQSKEPGALFLTGGASRMGFVKDICDDLFPRSKFVRDTRPEICISRGLALWGKTDYKIAGCLDEVEKFLEKDLLIVIRRKLPSFFDSLSEVLSEKILYKIVKSSMLSWQRGYTKTLRYMEEEILENSKKWLDGEEGKKTISDIVKEWLQDQVLKDIENEIDKISDKYELPKGSLIYGYGIPDLVGINSTEFSYRGQNITVEVSEAAVNFVLYAVISAIIGVVYVVIGLLVSLITGTIIAVIVAGLALFLWIPAVYEWAEKVKTDLSQGVSNATSQAIRISDIPSSIRPRLLSNSKVDEILTDNKSEIKSEIKKSLEDESKLVNKIVEETKEAIKKIINEQTDKAKLLIF